MDDDDSRGRLVNRREMLNLLGATGLTLLAGPSFAQSPRTLSCVATPEQTEGPYFVDEGLNRSDIRSDPADGSIRAGLPLILRLVVSSIDKTGCRPVSGAIVDIWHCDAAGAYSDARDPRFSTAGKKFLRGYQVTDQEGAVRFTTIYPGWYPGRAVHIHFKVRTAPKASRAYEFSSQLYFDDATTDRVHARMPYAERGARRARNAADGLFRDGGDQLMLRLIENPTEIPQGYAGSFHVGLSAPAR
jgi:protocatechuate 3,4-dioxygenase beta subunit